MQTYAVKWREPDGQEFVGRLAFEVDAVGLEGRSIGPQGVRVSRRFGYHELRGAPVSRGVERLDGRPAIVLEGFQGSFLVSSAELGGPIVQELVDRLAGLRLGSPRRAIVVVPLREGVLDQVKELVAQGPPFDPLETALVSHEVWLTPYEAIFEFEAATESGLLMLLSELDVWAAASLWGEFVAGQPRVADREYVWQRPEDGIAAGARGALELPR